MEVILLDNIENLGQRGQIVKVASGYGRNYLLPKKLAVAATPQNRKWVEQQRVRFLKIEAKEQADAQDLAKLLEGVAVTVKRKAGEKGTLFGSVTAMDISAQLAGKGYKIDRRKIHLEAPLKLLGEYDVPIKLHPQVTAKIKVTVEPEGELQPEALPAEPKAEAKAETQAEAKPTEAAAEAAPEASTGKE